MPKGIYKRKKKKLSKLDQYEKQVEMFHIRLEEFHKWIDRHIYIADYNWMVMNMRLQIYALIQYKMYIRKKRYVSDDFRFETKATSRTTI